jgi:dethiobiotin synthetase
MNGYFVTGTDTNVGKTYVTCALARQARARGHKVFAFKPIESGCALGADGHHIGADQELLVTAAGDWQQGPLRGLYQLPRPAAPIVAAEAAGTAIDLALIVQTARQGAAQSDASLTLVEGAGGWRVPITAAADMSTLARDLALPVLIVARAGLGTINHTLLTIEAVQRDRLRLVGVVLSQRGDEDPEASHSNRSEILRRWPGLVLILGSAPSVLDCLLEPGVFHVEHPERI